MVLAAHYENAEPYQYEYAHGINQKQYPEHFYKPAFCHYLIHMHMQDQSEKRDHSICGYHIKRPVRSKYMYRTYIIDRNYRGKKEPYRKALVSCHMRHTSSASF